MSINVCRSLICASIALNCLCGSRALAEHWLVDKQYTVNGSSRATDRISDLGATDGVSEFQLKTKKYDQCQNLSVEVVQASGRPSDANLFNVLYHNISNRSVYFYPRQWAVREAATNRVLASGSADYCCTAANLLVVGPGQAAKEEKILALGLESGEHEIKFLFEVVLGDEFGECTSEALDVLVNIKVAVGEQFAKRKSFKGISVCDGNSLFERQRNNPPRVCQSDAVSRAKYYHEQEMIESSRRSIKSKNASSPVRLRIVQVDSPDRDWVFLRFIYRNLTSEKISLYVKTFGGIKYFDPYAKRHFGVLGHGRDDFCTSEKLRWIEPHKTLEEVKKYRFKELGPGVYNIEFQKMVVLGDDVGNCIFENYDVSAVAKVVVRRPKIKNAHQQE